jgi:hypothetical protein
MALTVPPPQVAHIKMFLELSDDKIQGFLAALTEAGPQYSRSNLSHEVSSRTSLASDLTGGIVGVLGSLYLTWDAQSTKLEDFLDGEVYAALNKAETFSKENGDVQWAKLRRFLVSALSLENTVGTAAKAAYILTQHEHIFLNGRILTDIRPIFHLDVSEKPESAVIFHMLRITHRDNQRNYADQYFALDSNDIRSLKTLIDRALKKEETLKRLMRNSGITIVPPKESL